MNIVRSRTWAMTSWAGKPCPLGVHETTVRCTMKRVESALIASAQFQMLKNACFKKRRPFTASSQSMPLKCRADDQEKRAGPTRAPSCPRRQRRWYSGKKKQYTLKFQLLICTVTQWILDTTTCAGVVHDLKLFRLSGFSGVRLPHDAALIGDVGYQGLWSGHGHAITARKAMPASPLY
ncbi:transposase family protein [Deinococcus sp. UYEF24]